MEGKDTQYYISTLRYNISNYMAKNGLTIMGLAKITDVPASVLGRCLAEERPISLVNLIKLAKSTNLSLDWLLGLRTDDKLTNTDRKLVDMYHTANRYDRTIIDTLIQKYYSDEQKP